MGFTGLALGAMLHATASRARRRRWRRPTASRTSPPKAKSVIWLFMIGGISHMESFDPKPALNKYAGKTIAETPYKAVARIALPEEEPPRVRRRACTRSSRRSIPLQVGYQKRGQSGIEVSDWWPHLGELRRRPRRRPLDVDDRQRPRRPASVPHRPAHRSRARSRRSARGSTTASARSTTTCRSSSCWARRSPTAAAASAATAPTTSGRARRRAARRRSRRTRCRSPRPGRTSIARSSRREFDLLGRLNRLAGVEYPDDPALRARIKSYELAFRMQTAVPEVVDFDSETEATQTALRPRPAGRRRRSASSAWRRGGWSRRGVRFVQSSTAATAAPAPGTPTASLQGRTTRQLCGQVDQPIAGLLKDLKQRGLLDETLVVWATEFGRTPGAQGGDGRDHHPYGFSVWMAGGGIKGGIVHGATDELGFHAVENRHYVTDIHATVLHQLGLDPRTAGSPRPQAAGDRSRKGDQGHFGVTYSVATRFRSCRVQKPQDRNHVPRLIAAAPVPQAATLPIAPAGVAISLVRPHAVKFASDFMAQILPS